MSVWRDEPDEMFADLFPKCTGRIIVAAFSSSIHRVQQVADVAARCGRKILLNGRSMVKNVQIARDYEPALPDILVDPNQIEQVFVNMVVNACQAMPNGGHLNIAMHLDYDRHYLVTTIEDTGQGIPRENLEKIFDPFFTTKDQPANGLAGTGLGSVAVVGSVLLTCAFFAVSAARVRARIADQRGIVLCAP